MKNALTVFIISAFLFGALPAQAGYAEDEVYQENVIDKISDWAQTVGKDKAERDSILAERKAERQRKHAEKKAEQMKKKAEKKAQAMGKEAKTAKGDMKKKMGF